MTAEHSGCASLMLKSLPQEVILHYLIIHEHQLYAKNLNISNMKHVTENVITRTMRLKPSCGGGIRPR
jgi:hypothetical protein